MDTLPRNVLITGASSGLGRGLVCFFAQRGATVHAAARRSDLLESLRKELQVGPGSVVPLALDVAQAQNVIRRLTQLDTECGGLDLVIANAGVSEESDGQRLEWEKIERIIAVNVAGAAATLTAVLPGMVRRGRGQVVGVSSLAAMSPLPSYGAYNASKAFLTTFLECLRLDLAGTGVKVTVIHPGFVKSEMTAKNRFPMPFLLETADAVQRMGEAILRGKQELSFPWPLASAARTARFLPRAVLGFAAQRMKPAGGRWKTP